MLSLIAATLMLPMLFDDAHEKWVDLMSIGQGAHASVELDTALSDADHSVVHVHIPGFWAGPATGGDGLTYTGLELPGSTARTTDLGAPELPVLRFWLAVAPGTTGVVRDPSLPVGGQLATFALQELAGLPPGSPAPLIYPVHGPAWDGNPDAGTPQGIPAAYHFDASVYFGQARYPATTFDDLVAVEPLIGGLQAAQVELRPFHWDPATRQLVVLHDFDVAFDHPHPAIGPDVLVTPPVVALGEQLALNYEKIEVDYDQAPADEGYAGRTLVLAEKDKLGALLPLLTQRRLSGVDVEFLALESLPDTTPASIRAALADWVASAPKGSDSFALLVGDAETIPLHPSSDPNGQASDAPYGKPLPGDPDAQVFVGRLAVADTKDLALQVGKIVEFERRASVSNNFKQMGIACHGFNDVKGWIYEQFGLGLAAEIAASALGFQPQLILGSQSSASAKLVDQLDEGLGYLLYRGQGSSDSWGDWNGSGADMTVADVLALENTLTPIHWALAPSSAAIGGGESLAEAWMSSSGGAAAVLGALGPTQTRQAHELGHILGLRTAQNVPLGMLLPAVQAARESAASSASGADLGEQFLLLGDPAMTAPTGTSAATDDVWVDGKIITAENVALIDPLVFAPDGTASLHVRVEDAFGHPVDGALVAFVIGEDTLGPNGELVPAPFQVDAYTVEGEATLNVDLSLTALAKHPGFHHKGGLNFAMSDGSVKFISDEIPVQLGSFADLGGEVPNDQGSAPQLQSDDTLAKGSKIELSLQDALPGAPGLLFVALQLAPVPLEGGVFHVLPWALALDFVADGAGAAHFAIGPVPTTAPSGLPIVFQAITADPDGPFGLVLSNGLLGVL